MAFDVSGLGPGYYVRGDIEVPNPLDDKSESWELSFCCWVMFLRDEWVLEEGASVFFIGKGIENIFAVYI